MDRRSFNKLAGVAGLGAFQQVRQASGIRALLSGTNDQSNTVPGATHEKGSSTAWNHYLFGTAYYPEWWEPSEWEIDFREMQEVGINAVRMGEFAWALFEPSPGRFEFAWMDEAIAVANRHGVNVILGTTTASVPPWLYQLHPDVLTGNASGPYTYGGRKGYNTNSPNYLAACSRIVTALAEHYGSHPGVIGWQLDNEPGYPFLAFDPDSKRAFQRWLRKKYGTLDALNRAWNGAFWSNMYTDWSQIDFPANSAEGGWQPAITLAYRQFFSDSFLNDLRRQADILHRTVKDQFVSTNWPAPAWSVNVFTAATEFLDATAWDNYVIPPGIDSFQRQYSAGFNHDLARNAGPHQRFFCAEQMAYVPPNEPEEGLRLQAYTNLAHGAHGHLYFEWRRPLAGNEQFRPSFLKAFDGSIHAKPMLQKTSREFADLGTRLAGAVTRADIAILYSFDNSWSEGYAGIGPRDRPYNNEIGQYYNGLKALQCNIDFVPATRDFSAYKVILAPGLHMIDDATATRLCAFAAAGGTLVLNYGAATQHMDVSMRRMLSPGLFADAAGVTTGAHSVDFVEYQAQEKKEFEIRFSGEKGTFHPRTILESLTLRGAEAIAMFQGDGMEGRPAVTRNRHGRGWVFYAGTDSSDGGFYEALARAVSGAAHLSPLIAAPYGVEVVSREIDGTVFYFLLNFTQKPQPDIPLPRAMRDALKQDTRVTHVSLAPFDVAVLAAEKAE